MKQFSDEKVVIITGASSGIGQDTAVKFVEKGITKLCLNGRNGEGLEKTKQDCLAVNKDVETVIVQGDLRTEGMCERIVNETVDKFGRVDVLFNNACLLLHSPISDPSMEAFQTVFDINLKSAIKLTKLCIPYLRQTKGNIINNSSFLATNPLPNYSNYCMTKAAMDMLTKCIAVEEGKNGIRANNVNPGLIATPLGENSGLPKEIVDSYWEKVKNDTPVGRIGASADVANLVTFIASDEAAFMSGSLVLIDRGLDCRNFLQ